MSPAADAPFLPFPLILFLVFESKVSRQLARWGSIASALKWRREMLGKRINWKIRMDQGPHDYENIFCDQMKRGYVKCNAKPEDDA